MKTYIRYLLKIFFTSLLFVTGIIFIVALNFLNYEFKLNESVNMVIFIGLASLTFPHILLEYLIEKNEK